MHQDRSVGVRVGRRLGHVALFVALAAVPVLAFNSFATANTGSGGATRSDPFAHLTDTQRQCLAGQGVTVPAHTGDGTHPTITTSQRQAFRRAAAACGIGGVHRWGEVAFRHLTDAQRQCLAGQGVSLPNRTSAGTRPTITAEQFAALQHAATACGIPVPGSGVTSGADQQV